ncbi:MAG: hypothetical protein QG622_94 [Actinomycetota bacterium]|nr:hypothetical protein [Actinomycetota bacterium]
MAILDLAALGQDGVATRQQVLSAGVTVSQLRRRLASGEWQHAYRGVYVLFSGPIPPRSLVWAAILAAGAGAAAGPRTSLWLAGAYDRPPSPLDVVVPSNRNPLGVDRIVIIRRRDLVAAIQPGTRPPRLRVEAAALDLCRRLDRSDAAVDVITRVVQRRLTTAARLRGELDARRTYPRRRLLIGVLTDVEHGVRSVLEYEWLNTVERAHGLPPSTLNRPDDQCGQREYRDAEFKEYALVVELDGREWHGGDQVVRDRQRDNRVTVSGRRTLRYGWHEIANDPCGVAAEVAAVLNAQGWTGRPRPCGPRCSIGSGSA